jgi:hypothetical protein
LAEIASLLQLKIFTLLKGADFDGVTAAIYTLAINPPPEGDTQHAPVAIEVVLPGLANADVFEATVGIIGGQTACCLLSAVYCGNN